MKRTNKPSAPSRKADMHIDADPNAVASVLMRKPGSSTRPPTLVDMQSH